MTKAIAPFVLVMASIVFLLLLGTSNSISAQNMSNMTTSGSPNLAKMHLEEAIDCLEVGNNESASIHLNAAHQDLPGVSIQAEEQFEAGMKALSTGDSNCALIHLKAADVQLSSES